MNSNLLILLLILIVSVGFGFKKLAETSKFQLFGEMLTQVDTPEKVVALTYDDGPNPIYTRRLLRVLARCQAKATFFVIGKQVEQYPEIVRDIRLQGHELGNHSYSHRQLILTSRSVIRNEICKTDQLLRRNGVQPAIHFRAPFGYKRIRLPLVLSQLKKKNVLWNVDPRDYRSSSSETVVSHVLDRVKPGSIVLLHDGRGDRTLTIEATAQLIPKLKALGYRLVTISELLSLQPPKS